MRDVWGPKPYPQNSLLVILEIEGCIRVKAKPMGTEIPLKPPQTKIIGVNFGARRILSPYLSTELNSVFRGVLGTCLTPWLNDTSSTMI